MVGPQMKARQKCFRRDKNSGDRAAKSPSAVMHARMATGFASDSNDTGRPIVVSAEKANTKYELEFRNSATKNPPAPSWRDRFNVVRAAAGKADCT
jgi:hypothetical protein